MSKSKECNIFHSINEFFDVEEIKENLLNISLNFKKLRFRFDKNYKESEKFFAILNSSEKKTYIAQDIFFPFNVNLINLKEYLFSKISNNVNFKILLKIENKKGDSYSPIEKINFILEETEVDGNYIVMDIVSDVNIRCFKAFIVSLKYLNLTDICS